jgi:hypothetical protein
MDGIDFREALRRIQMDYLEMPELKLTKRQARRLWTLSDDVCDAAMASLVAAGFLTRARDGSFLRRGRLPVRVDAVDQLTWVIG